MIFNAQLVSLLLGTVAALPAVENVAHRRRDHGLEPQYYRAPGPTDSRGPCPALNTLANHGFLNRDGRNLARQDIIDAVATGFGIAESAIDTALVNYFIVCEYVTGASCGTVAKNLTLLAEPHAFEHDHSFSRQDYKPAYLGTFAEHADNKNLNLTIFEGSSLATLEPGATHVNYTQANALRQERERNSLETSWPGWFLQDIPVQEFEFAYIFAVVPDTKLPNAETYPQIRLDFWKYWFINESFPTPLGWLPPSPPVEVDYILSASSRILEARLATQSPLPTNAAATAPPATLPAAAATVYPLASDPAYIGPIGAPAGHHHGRDPHPHPHPGPAPGPHPHPAPRAAAATPLPTFAPMQLKNPYAEKLELGDIVAQQVHAAAVLNHMESLRIGALSN